MAKRFARDLTPDQMREAREFESAGITTISQAVKAFQERPQSLADFRAKLAGIKAIQQDHREPTQ